MAKTKSAGSGKKTEAALFLPGPEYWEIWKSNGDGAFRREETTEWDTLSPEKVPGGVRFAYSVTSAFAVPFWAATSDPALLEDVGDLQLEKLGLKPSTIMGKLREFNVIDQVGGRSLAVATVLAPPPGTGFSRQPPESFQVSPFHYRLPNDSVTVWRELGRLVMTVTRNETPVYFAALSAAEIDAGAMQEIRCILLQLGTQEAIPGIDELVLWLGPERDEKIEALVKKELGVPMRFAAPPAPGLAARESTLVPEEIATVRHQREQRRRWRNRLVVAALGYMIVIGIFVGRYILTQRKANALRDEIAMNSPDAEAVRSTMARWESLRLAIDVDSYPAETLLKVSSLLPPRGVRLTEFEVDDNSILLKGESSSAPEAIKFKGVLMGAPSLAIYEWNFPQPIIVPGKGATFIATGKLKNAGPEEK